MMLSHYLATWATVWPRVASSRPIGILSPADAHGPTWANVARHGGVLSLLGANSPHHQSQATVGKQAMGNVSSRRGGCRRHSPPPYIPSHVMVIWPALSAGEFGW